MRRNQSKAKEEVKVDVINQLNMWKEEYIKRQGRSNKTLRSNRKKLKNK